MNDLAELRESARELARAEQVDVAEVLQIFAAFSDMVADFVSDDDARLLLPFNFDERMDYIRQQPARFHARIQLFEIIDEFLKKYAVWQAKHG